METGAAGLALLAAIRAGNVPRERAAEIAGLAAERRAEVIGDLLPDPAGRRWLRAALLARLPNADAASLAATLLRYRADLDPSHRDRSTPELVATLPLDSLQEHAPLLAGSNAAGAFWERLTRDASASLPEVAARVLREGLPFARETALQLLLREPLAVALSRADRLRLLATALDDPADEVRGVAVELLAELAPELVLDRLAALRLDPSQQVRGVAWEMAFAAEPEQAAEDALALILDDDAPLDARRSALLAVGTALPTGEVAPLLAVLVRHPRRELAEDAADLLWNYHRTPVVAEAAAQSVHPSVRAIAERLLHPELGSPAAGGSRPGAPTGTADVYRELIERLERDAREEGGSSEGSEPIG